MSTPTRRRLLQSGLAAAATVSFGSLFWRRTVTLATLNRRSARGRTVLRLKPTKAAAKLLRPRRRALTATLEVRFTTDGAPVRTIRQSVSLRPKT